MPEKKIKEKGRNQARQEKPCNHFMVWNIQGGYSYYRCDKCNYIDGKKIFEEEKQKWERGRIIAIDKQVLKELPQNKEWERIVKELKAKWVEEILEKINKDYKGRDITIYELGDWLGKQRIKNK